MLSHPEDAGSAGGCVVLADLLAASWSREWGAAEERAPQTPAGPSHWEIRKGRVLACNINTCDYNKWQSCENPEAATEREERCLEKATQEVWPAWGTWGKISKKLIWFPGAENGVTGIWFHTRPPTGLERTPPWHKSQAHPKKPLLPTSIACVIPSSPSPLAAGMGCRDQSVLIQQVATANGPEALPGVILVRGIVWALGALTLSKDVGKVGKPQSLSKATFFVGQTRQMTEPKILP